ncbi:Ribonucleases P/MRP protein subunit pop1 [Kalmusia sp. IMI 367209]|nr:Ribonucleases P/MRP protein subunit pop1 [Kalmusia sp. IMI 367209]
MSSGPGKRKQTSDAAPAAKRPRFPQRPQKHRIATAATSTAYPNGEINVKSFLNSHQNEIKALENAMRAAKKGLSRRAFQDVPRELRRRTASHNPQRVPKRLRVRARQEAKEDNTPITRGTSGSGVGKEKKKWLRKEGIERSRKGWEERKRRRKAEKDSDVTVEPMEGVIMQKDANAATKEVANAKTTRNKSPALATPETPPSRFRRRQKDKTWLPTHVWHTKRARMTPPKEPLWRFAIPLAPAVKAYRLTHRAAALRGAVAWDMSYISTVSLEGVEASVSGLLKGLHFSQETEDNPWQERGKAKRWRNGTRAWEGWIYEREGGNPKGIAYITVIWCVPEEGKAKRKAFIRVHPCAFLQLWNELIRIAKVQKPAVTVEDLRFEIGSIEIMGPAAAETLCSILHPSAPSDPSSPQTMWPTLAGVTDPGVLPPGALLSFPICDPRLRDPPRTAQIAQDAESQVAFIETLANWPVDGSQTASVLFDRNSRLAAARSLPSQKSINRRKGVDSLGEYPEPRRMDPQIPMLVYTSKQSKSWTVLLPWKCVMPVWRGIMRYPVSTGGNPRFGGLKERRQVDFERSVPSFPFDYPGSDAGWGWELQERVAREHDWTKRPKGKRIEWSTIDLGNGRKGEVGDPWACDWERLVSDHGEHTPMIGAESKLGQSPVRQVSLRDARELTAGRPVSIEYQSTPHLFTVKISMIQRGTPTNCARVYRLPTNNVELRNKWLSLMPNSKSASTCTKGPKQVQHPRNGTLPEQVERRNLARSLLEPPPARNGPPRAGDEDYPVVPDDEDLIGFVTTGNYNLAEGMPTGIANLALHKAIDGSSDGKSISKEGRVCIIREAGRTIGRLASWEIV